MSTDSTGRPHSVKFAGIELATRVQTVLGPVDPSEIGPVLIHEHLLFDFTHPGKAGDKYAEITPENRWQIDYWSNRSPTNSHQFDRDVAAAELRAFSLNGGSLVVDQTVWGLSRDPVGLARASSKSGVHVVAATGPYTARYQDSQTRDLDVNGLADRIVRELTIGMDGTSTRAGIIGEIGCSWPLDEFEIRALAAAADAQRQVGVSISIHPGRNASACNQIVDILEQVGANLDRVVLCHMDRTHPNGDGIRPLLERGVNVEWDFFGIEQSHYWMGNVELPTDLQRLRQIKDLAAAGHGHRLLVSHDICTRTRMHRWGGHGYGHILRNVVELMRRLEFDDILIDRLLRGNPLRMLTIEED